MRAISFHSRTAIRAGGLVPPCWVFYSARGSDNKLAAISVRHGWGEDTHPHQRNKPLGGRFNSDGQPLPQIGFRRLAHLRTGEREQIESGRKESLGRRSTALVVSFSNIPFILLTNIDSQILRLPWRLRSSCGHKFIRGPHKSRQAAIKNSICGGFSFVA